MPTNRAEAVPEEFRADVIRVARSRGPRVTLKQVAADFGVSESCLTNWLTAADRKDGVSPGRRPVSWPSWPSCEEADPAVGAGERGVAPGGGVSVAGDPAGEVIYPLVRELAAEGIPVAVTCRVQRIARQPYYRWFAALVAAAEWEQAHRTNAIFDAHRDDPEFGYRSSSTRPAMRRIADLFSLGQFAVWYAGGYTSAAAARLSGVPCSDADSLAILSTVDRTGVLLQAAIFHDLSERDVEELLPELRERAYGRGESVWMEGDPADSLFFLAEGQLKSYRVSRDGVEVILGFNSSVDVVGEVGLFHPSGVRQVCVSAMEPSRCLTMSRARLLAFMTRHPMAMQRMLERLSTIAVRAAYSFSGVAFDDIQRRVASALLALADEFGEPTDEGVRIRLRLSQATLAALVAASRENVNRALSSFVATRAVSQRNGHFYVHDRPALERANAPWGDGLEL